MSNMQHCRAAEHAMKKDQPDHNQVELEINELGWSEIMVQ